MKADVIKLISIFLTIMIFLIGTLTWATSEHAETKEWTSEQIYKNVHESEERSKEIFVKKEDFATLNQKLENLNEKQDMLLKAIDKIDKKTDSQYKGNR